MMRALIVEDEKNNTERLLRLLKKNCPDVEAVALADSVRTAVIAIEENNPELVFLDVELPDGSGFDILHHIDKIDFEIIFVTAHDKYAVKAIKFSAVDYLLKPVDDEELKKAVKKAQEKIKTHSDKENYNFLKQQTRNHKDDFSKIAVSTAKGYQIVEIVDVVRCQADRNYTQLFLKNGKSILVSRTLKEFEEMLEEHRFCRIHHAHLINLNHVIEYVKGEGGHAVMSDQSKVDVSKRRKEDFLSRLQRV